MSVNIVFTHIIAGHYLEYIHHCYLLALTMPTQQWIFVVPEQFKSVKYTMNWPGADNIDFDYISNEEQKKCECQGLLRSCYNVCKVLKQRISFYHADKVLVLSMMSHLPFAPFFYHKKLEIAGIVYKIYLHDWANNSIHARILDLVKYTIMSRFKVIKQVYILNDSASCRKLNDIYRTRKFHYLADPYLPLISGTSPVDLRKELGITENQRLFVHFGALSARKGTMLILDSLQYLNDQQRNMYVFAFVGSVDNSIKQEFYQRINQYKKQIHIYVKDEFCSFDYLRGLCEACDGILMPYLHTAQSSGVIGYASQFGKPVVAPRSGLIGKLVRRYKLGKTIPLSSMSLIEAYDAIANEEVIQPDRSYVEQHTVAIFQGVLLQFFES